jgi:hypothetical protein
MPRVFDPSPRNARLTSSLAGAMGTAAEYEPQPHMQAAPVCSNICGERVTNRSCGAYPLLARGIFEERSAGSMIEVPSFGDALSTYR